MSKRRIKKDQQGLCGNGEKAVLLPAKSKNMQNTYTHHKASKELEYVIDDFHRDTSAKQRFASFDFCYGYFQTHRHHLVENMELSCLHLWSYLASWGMLRGSSKLLQECSMKSLSKVVKYIDRLPERVWNIDVPDYVDEDVLDKILNIYTDLKERIADIKFEEDNTSVSPTKTLVTKIMLGTLGSVPAFDNNFVKAFKKEFSTAYQCPNCCRKKSAKCAFSELNRISLNSIYCFYLDNKKVLDNIHYLVIGFNGKPTMNLTYKKAKLIDMYGFSISMKC